MTTTDITIHCRRHHGELICRGPRGWWGVLNVSGEAIVDPHQGRRTAYGAAMAARTAARGLRERRLILIQRPEL